MRAWRIFAAANLAAVSIALSAEANQSIPTALLEATLGKAPEYYSKSIVPDAKKLRAALDLAGRKKIAEARTKLKALNGSSMKEWALLELARLEIAAKRTDAALLVIADLQQHALPPSVERDLIQWEKTALFERAAQKARTAKSNAEKLAVAQAFQKAFSKTPYREWEEWPEALETMVRWMKSANHPLWKNQLAEALFAIPAASPLRKKITEGFSPKEIQEVTALPRYRSGSETVASPVKASYPDLELFEQGMVKVLEEEWTEAEELFHRLLKEYPTSEHAERANFWIARMLEERGLSEDAKKRFGEIFQNSPLSYYGLEAALRIGQTPLAEVKDSEPGFAPITGALFPRQQLALWRLRAFLETGLLDFAQIQMEELFHYRPNGLFGQEEPNRALSLAFLYHWSGYHLGAFTQAYGATSLDRALLTKKTLDIIFPVPFAAEVEKAAQAAQVHPQLIRALMKQESAFLPQAMSRSNALGLMQLLHSTAKDVEKDVTRADLFIPEVNSRVGSAYLRYLLDRFEGNIPLSLAAYNAGPARAMAWQKKLLESPLMKKEFRVDVFIDTIPFTETRRYVGSVLRNYWWYRAKSGLPAAKSIQELLQLWQKDEPKT